MDQKHPIVIFDGVCNLCEDSVNFIIRHDRLGRFRFVSAQSDRGRELQRFYSVDAIKDETVILIKDGRIYTQSDAGMEIAKDLDGLWKGLAFGRIVPRPIRNRIYAVVAGNRYRWFGKKGQCLVPDESTRARFMS